MKNKQFKVKLLSAYSKFLTKILKLLNIRFLELESLRGIGHQALEPASFFIEKKLKLNPYKMIYFFSMRNNTSLPPIHNRVLLSYWKKYFLTYLHENSNSIYEKVKFKLFKPLLYPGCFEINQLESLLISPQHYILRDRDSNVSYELLNYYRKPLLKLKKAHEKEGSRIVRKWGLTEKDWFITFHARDPTYYQSYPNKLIADYDIQSYKNRNVEVDDYYLALKEVVNRGGYCIRIGAKNIEKLPKKILDLGNVIDYPLSGDCSETMDIFLFAKCKFLIGCNSGPIYVPGLFGKPSIGVQVSPCWGLPAYHHDKALIKKYWSIREKRFLTLKEMFSPPIYYLRTDEDFSKNEVTVVDNTPEEIRDVVLEMLNDLEGKSTYSAEDEERHVKFLNALDPVCPCYGFAGKLGSSFLKKHEDDFFESQAQHI